MKPKLAIIYIGPVLEYVDINKRIKFMSKKRKKNRVYSEDFKREAVSMYENSPKTCEEVFRLMDISAVSVLNRWRVIYGSQKMKRGDMKDLKGRIKEASFKREVQLSKSDDAAKIAGLEDEVRHLRQILGTHAVKEYLAKLREESWREITTPETAKEVDKIVAKKR